MKMVYLSTIAANLRKISTDMGIRQLHKRVAKKMSKLLPEDLQSVFKKCSAMEFEDGADLDWKQPVKVLEDLLDTIVARFPPDQKATLKKQIKQLRPSFDDLQYEYSCEWALLSLRFAKHLKTDDRPYFKSTRFVKKIFIAAIDRDDLNFFERVGDTLRKHQTTLDGPISGRSTLQRFLIDNWCYGSNGVPPLYNLSINELCEICKKSLNQYSLSPFSVDKTRQRMGLITFRNGLVLGR